MPKKFIIVDKTIAKIGAIDINSPAILDLINCSDQLIRKNGKKFPKNPINSIIKIVFLSGSNFKFFILKKKYKIIEAIMSLPDAILTGFKVSTLIFMAKKADPHIAPKIKRSIKILGKNRLLSIFWFREFYVIVGFHKIISLTIP